MERLFALIFTLAVCQSLNAQIKKTSNNYDLRLDSLGMSDILKIERERPSFKLDYPPDISFDSAQIELVYSGEIIAIIPYDLRRSISEKYVASTRFKIEKLAGGKILLRIFKLMDFKLE